VFACLCIRHRKDCANGVAIKPSKLKEIDSVHKERFVCIQLFLCAASRLMAPLKNVKFENVRSLGF